MATLVKLPLPAAAPVPAAPPLESGDPGATAYALVRELYPICRSISGQGVRDTLDILERFVPLARTQVASGTRMFDWDVPLEWNIRDAWIKDASGRRVVDFRVLNLHVVS